MRENLWKALHQKCLFKSHCQVKWQKWFAYSIGGWQFKNVLKVDHGRDKSICPESHPRLKTWVKFNYRLLGDCLVEKTTTVSDGATALTETIQQEKEDWDGLFWNSIQITWSIFVLDWLYRNSRRDARRKISKNYVRDYEAIAVDKICNNSSC